MLDCLRDCIRRGSVQLTKSVVTQDALGKVIALDTKAFKPLENERYEIFAQAIAKGETHWKAYKKAGYRPNSKSASSLAQKPEIRERVRQIHMLALEDTKLDIRRVVAELEKIGFANMLDYIKIDDAGQPRLDFTELKRETAAAIGEIQVEEETDRNGVTTRKTKFKLLDKKGALVDLGRYLGMFIDRKEHTHKGIMFHVSKEDMAL